MDYDTDDTDTDTIDSTNISEISTAASSLSSRGIRVHRNLDPSIVLDASVSMAALGALFLYQMDILVTNQQVWETSIFVVSKPVH